MAHWLLLQKRSSASNTPAKSSPRGSPRRSTRRRSGRRPRARPAQFRRPRQPARGRWLAIEMFSGKTSMPASAAFRLVAHPVQQVLPGSPARPARRAPGTGRRACRRQPARTSTRSATPPDRPAREYVPSRPCRWRLIIRSSKRRRTACHGTSIAGSPARVGSSSGATTVRRRRAPGFDRPVPDRTGRTRGRRVT